MAFRSPSYWKSMLSPLRGSSSFTTSTLPKMKVYAPTNTHDTKSPSRALKGDFVPVYVALGMIMLSTTLGMYTGVHELKYCPSVHLRKSRRETLPELEEPDHVVEESDKYIKKSFFRKVAHIQEFQPTIRVDVLAIEPRAETLKSVGVDPKVN